MKHYVKAIENRRSCISLFFGFRNNFTSLSIKGLPRSNFADLGIAPQAQFLIYIFFSETLCDRNQKSKFLYFSLH